VADDSITTEGGLILAERKRYTCKNNHSWIADPKFGLKFRFFTPEIDRDRLKPEWVYDIESRQICPYCLRDFLSREFGAVEEQPYKTVLGLSIGGDNEAAKSQKPDGGNHA
jgi:hypothetical protein